MGGSKRSEKRESRKLQRRHICPNCGATFPFPNKLRNHIKSSHSQSHACEHCDARFDRFNELRTHTAFAHHIRYKCHLCAYSSSVKAELKKHTVVNHENGVCCTIEGCNITVAYRMLKKHIREAHTSEDENVSRKGAVVIAGVEDTTALTVDIAPEVPQQESPNGDEKSHPAANTFEEATENIIGQELEETDEPSTSGGDGALLSVESHSVAAVEDHLAVPSPSSSSTSCADGLLSCSETGCFKRFHRMRDLKRHRLRVHNSFTALEEAEFKFVCEHSGCTRRFPTAGRLRQHVATHGDGYLVKCISCRKSFKNRANFAVHLRKYHLMSVRDVNYSPLFVSVSKSVSGLVEGAA